MSGMTLDEYKAELVRLLMEAALTLGSREYAELTDFEFLREEGLI